MAWVFLEVLVALFLLIGIIWWTLPSKREEEQRHSVQKNEDEQQAGRSTE